MADSLYDAAVPVFESMLKNLSSLLDKGAAHAAAKGYVDELGIRTPNVHQKIGFLSGGNQQKAIIARCLFAQPKVVILDEPTQGIDIGAKSEVYRLINHFVLSGGSVIVISSELPELIGISDRILVMSEGRIAGEVLLRNVGDHPQRGHLFPVLVQERIQQGRAFGLAAGAEQHPRDQPRRLR